MVLYFSGTGNSTFVAVTLGNFLGLELKFIPETDPQTLDLQDKKLVLIFPVYSWGVPPLVSDFIRRMPEEVCDRIRMEGIELHCVMTCGDEVALAPEMIKKDFKKIGLKLESIQSVIMPNNYVLLPGFDVDAKDLEQRKLKECEGRILEVAQSIGRGDRRIDVVRGSLPWIKTKLVFPLFRKWGIFPSKWHYSSSCISCGKCARICSMMNVTMKNEHPVWGTRCCSCLGCYHVCPVHAVEYGKATVKKGQYIFPLPRIADKNFHKIP